MGFFSNLAHKWSGKHILTDEDRKLAEEIKQKKLEIRKAELERQAEIQRIKDERMISNLTKGDEDTAMLMQLLMTAISSPKTTATTPTEPLKPTSEINLINLSNEDIEAIISELPPIAITAAKSMSNNAIRQFVEQKVGKLDDDTFTRIINRIRG